MANRVAAAKQALEARLADFTPAQREKALTRHYDNYWLAFDEDELERHARVLARADAEGKLLALDAVTNNFRAITEVLLYTPDNAGLFSQFAGAIATAGIFGIVKSLRVVAGSFAIAARASSSFARCACRAASRPAMSLSFWAISRSYLACVSLSSGAASDSVSRISVLQFGQMMVGSVMTPFLPVFSYAANCSSRVSQAFR